MDQKELRSIIKRGGEGNSRAIQTESSALRKAFDAEFRREMECAGLLGSRGRNKERERRRNEIFESVIALMCKNMDLDPRFYFKKLDDLRQRRSGLKKSASSQEKAVNAKNVQKAVSAEKKPEKRKRPGVRSVWEVPEKMQFKFSIRELFKLTLTANELYGRFGVLQEAAVSFAIFHEHYGKEKWRMATERLRHYEHSESDLQHLDWLTPADFFSISTSDSFQARIKSAFKDKKDAGISSSFLKGIEVEIKDLANIVLVPRILNRIQFSDKDVLNIFLSSSGTEMFGRPSGLPFDPDSKSVTLTLLKEKEQINCFRARKCPFFSRCLRLSFQLAKQCAPLFQKRNQGACRCLSCTGCGWTNLDAFIKRQGSTQDDFGKSLAVQLP
ncbi:MAG TPA: hypothetical protein DCX32_04065 [Candidatus Moranbacteria bacterium]|nr:hypothetical protein [Candidatus Moranbacteria bacterium]